MSAHSGLVTADREVDVTKLPAGCTLHVVTSDSTWYFTATTVVSEHGHRARGVSIQANSPHFGGIAANPAETEVSRFIQQNSPVHIRAGRKDYGKTGEVTMVWLQEGKGPLQRLI